jgi:hypothetical protein
MIEDYRRITQIAMQDVVALEIKGKTYGSSWKARGGVGAFMMLARKWDRIENIAKAAGWDILEAGVQNTGDVLDDIADLRRYLLLVEAEVYQRYTNDPLSVKGENDTGSGPHYVNQD